MSYQCSKLKLYAVSDWRNYWLIKSTSPAKAVIDALGTSMSWIENPDDNDVVNCMVLIYSGAHESILEAMPCDFDRVLYLNDCPDTYHFRP
ncbi:hypothetical protein P0F09_003203 [Vibrio metschnikovii]|uniref:C-type lectin domain-containing protein n=1 Tax=bacterium 19MO02SH05 TaxID=2920696 RepID=A0AAU6THN5_UNCXX|nr:hypothetical protein [Vibrio metschnikovii]EKO3604683.1 hypothetical protein [Vibrio metschnikovii]EKO3895403.1 hypothetical protein [Vibrio metschnikovii]EKQ5812021.1 hypothetical protein [Vibrio metschnikovii]EKQ5812469.1 hypothetical protein [Vibrio metschnikovii]